MNFIIQKLKSKHTSHKKYTNWAKLIFSRFEGTRGEKNQIFRTLAVERGEELVVIQSDFGSGWTYVQGVHGVGFVPTKILYFV